MYVFLGLHASACSFQDFDALDKGYGVVLGVGGDSSASGGGQGGGAPSGGAPSGGAPSGGSAGTGVEPEPANLIGNPSFETGHGGWIPMGASTLVDVSTGAHSGDKCVLSSGRTDAWMGPGYTAAISLLTPGNNYLMSAWLRMVTNPENAQLTLKHDCDANPQYTPVTNVLIGTEWTKIEGVLRVPDCDLVELTPYFEGPPPNVEFWLDDVSITLVE